MYKSLIRHLKYKSICKFSSSLSILAFLFCFSSSSPKTFSVFFLFCFFFLREISLIYNILLLFCFQAGNLHFWVSFAKQTVILWFFVCLHHVVVVIIFFANCFCFYCAFVCLCLWLCCFIVCYCFCTFY